MDPTMLPERNYVHSTLYNSGHESQTQLVYLPQRLKICILRRVLRLTGPRGSEKLAANAS